MTLQLIYYLSVFLRVNGAGEMAEKDGTMVRNMDSVAKEHGFKFCSTTHSCENLCMLPII